MIKMAKLDATGFRTCHEDETHVYPCHGIRPHGKTPKKFTLSAVGHSSL